MENPQQLYFEDFAAGQIYRGQRRVLEEHAFRKFPEVTGDAHPIHYDAEYASRTHDAKCSASRPIRPQQANASRA